MNIWRATPSEAALVGRLLAEFNAEFDTPGPSAGEFGARFESLLDSPNVLVLVSGDPSDPLGLLFCTLRPTPYYDGPIAQLEEFWVRPADRGQGLGSHLLEAMLAWAHGLAVGEIQINVDEPDLATRRFYERHGFTNVQPGTSDRMLCYLREL